MIGQFCQVLLFDLSIVKKKYAVSLFIVFYNKKPQNDDVSPKKCW